MPRPNATPANNRSLAPREHGAYGQLFVPLVCGLAMAIPTLATIGVAVAGVAAFFAHEPVLVLLGRRGERTRRELGAKAKKRLLWLGALVIAGGATTWFGPWMALLLCGLPLTLGAALGAFVARDEEKTLGGEVLAAAALSSVAVPVAAESGVAIGVVLGAWIAWTASFAAATWSVRSVIAYRKTGMHWLRRVCVPVLILGAAIGAALSGLAPTAATIATLPMAVLAVAFAAIPPHPRSLRRVGWSLAASSVATGGILIAGAHLA